MKMSSEGKIVLTLPDTNRVEITWDKKKEALVITGPGNLRVFTQQDTITVWIYYKPI